jgi:hypothetical protein
MTTAEEVDDWDMSSEKMAGLIWTYTTSGNKHSKPWEWVRLQREMAEMDPPIRPKYEAPSKMWETIHTHLNGSVEGKPLDMDKMIDVDVHPLFALDKFDGCLITSEIYEALKPALQLSTLLITDDCFLDWWVHIRYSRLRRNPVTSMGCLEPGDIPDNAKDVVREELEALAAKIHILWDLPEKREGSGNFAGRFSPTTRNLTRILQKPFPIEEHVFTEEDYKKLDETNACSPSFQPTIVLNPNVVKAAMICTHSKAVPDLLRKHMWFNLANTLTHELAHCWYALCHPFNEENEDEEWPLCYEEPLVYFDDEIPEVGQSWEKFWLGGDISSSPFDENNEYVDYDFVRSLTYSERDSQYCAETPTYRLHYVVPDGYVEQWFLKETWENIQDLKTKGRLNVRSYDPETSVVRLKRRLNFETKNIHHIGGRAIVNDKHPNYHQDATAVLEPGNKQPWPKDTKALRDMYLKVWAKERAFETAEQPNEAGEVFHSEQRMYDVEFQWITDLRVAERALRLQGMDVPTTTDGWTKVYEDYKKDPFMLKTALRINFDMGDPLLQWEKEPVDSTQGKCSLTYMKPWRGTDEEAKERADKANGAGADDEANEKTDQETLEEIYKTLDSGRDKEIAREAAKGVDENTDELSINEEPSSTLLTQRG